MEDLLLKVRIEKIIEGTYGYDSIIITEGKNVTDIVFDKKIMSNVTRESLLI